MAVSIDTVYQKVLALANKEQRGYITPQEFNLFADHAQKEIFEQYFYDLNQFSRVLGNSTEYSDIIDNINEKIAIFETTGAGLNLASDLYRLGTVISASGTEIEEVQPNELLYINNSAILKPNLKRSVYVRNGNTIVVTPSSSNVSYTYTRLPAKPNWAYVIINDKALYNGTPGVYVDFELHPSEEPELVYKILALAGVAIEKPQLVQTAAGLGAGQIQQEKQ